jgi:hypothetical protein
MTGDIYVLHNYTTTLKLFKNRFSIFVYNDFANSESPENSRYFAVLKFLLNEY